MPCYFLSEQKVPNSGSVLFVEFTFLGLFTGGGIIKTDWVSTDAFAVLLAALMPANRLALITSATTGLRIDDVLHIRTVDLERGERFSVRERKTGKNHRIRISHELHDALLRQSGRYWAFEGRLDPKKPRTRQAVYKDLKRACKAFRLRGVNVAPHTARKIYAVAEYKRTCSLERVRELLNHSDEAVTILYAMADELSERAHRRQSVNIPTTNI